MDTVVQVLKEIEEVAPSKEHYSNLCLLLTMNKLSDHPDYKSWNPSKGRHKCFKDVLPLVEDLLSPDRRLPKNQTEDEATDLVASNDRLLQLIIKGTKVDKCVIYTHSSELNGSYLRVKYFLNFSGILYESCVDYCQQKATGAKHSEHIKFTNLLSQSDFSDR